MPTPSPLAPRGAVRVIDRFKAEQRDVTCTVSRRGAGRGDGGAANAGAFGLVVTAPCRIVSANRAGNAGPGAGGRFVAGTDYRAMFGRGVDVQSQDQIEVTGGQKYTVVTVNKRSHGFETVAELKEGSQ